ncbi:MAG: glycosyltransferase [Fimbriiglobus sp.]
MKVGTICYATRQGIGHLPRSFYDAGVVTDVMTFRHGSRPAAEGWYPEGTVELVGRPFTGPVVEAFIKSVDLMLFFETPFDWDVLALCKRLGTKTAVVPMYECTPVRRPHEPDAWLCPSLLDCEYFLGSPFVPIPVDPPKSGWVKREEATMFVHNGGNLGLRGHKGTLELLKATRHVKSPDFMLTVRAQDEKGLKALVDQCPWVKADPRVSIEPGEVDEARLFEGFDVFIMVEKYNGLSLPLREARAAGMVVVTTDRFPTNTWLPRGPLIPVKSYSAQRVGGAYNPYQEAYATPEAIAETIDRVIDMTGPEVEEYSESGRDWAERNSWRELKPVWADHLRRVVDGGR